MTTSEGATAPGSEISPQAESDGEGPDTAPVTGTVAAPPPDPRQLAQEIEQTREQLGDTVQELVARIDATRRPLTKATELTGKVKNTTVHAYRTAVETQDRWMPLAAGGAVLIAGFLAIGLWRRHQA
jgi:hypothetical protein